MTRATWKVRLIWMWAVNENTKLWKLWPRTEASDGGIWGLNPGWWKVVCACLCLCMCVGESIGQRVNLWIRKSSDTKCSLSTLCSKSNVHSQRQSSELCCVYIVEFDACMHPLAHRHPPTHINKPIRTKTNTWIYAPNVSGSSQICSGTSSVKMCKFGGHVKSSVLKFQCLAIVC